MSTQKQPGGILWAVPTAPFPATCRLAGPVEEHCHHITLTRGRYCPTWEALLGQTFDVRIIADAWSDEVGAQAYVVDLPEALQMLVQPTPQQRTVGLVIPHITLFTRQGVKPFASNSMLVGVHHRAPALLKGLQVRLAFCPEVDIDTHTAHSYRQQA